MNRKEVEKAAKELGLELFDKEQKEKLLKNHAETVKESAQSEYRKGQLESYKKAFGVEVEEGEEADAYLNRVAKSSKETATKLSADLEELKKKGTMDESLKARVGELEGLLKTEKANLKKIAEEKDNALREAKIDMKVESVMSAIRSKYRKDLPEDVIEAIEEKRLKEVRSRIKLDEKGEVQLVGDDGLPLKNQSNYEAVSLSEHLTENFKSVLDNDGGGKRGAGTKDTPPPASKIPTGITTRVQLTEHLQTLDAPQAEKDAIYQEAIEKNLPVQ